MLSGSVPNGTVVAGELLQPAHCPEAQCLDLRSAIDLSFNKKKKGGGDDVLKVHYISIKQLFFLSIGVRLIF